MVKDIQKNSILIRAFYKFFDFHNYQDVRAPLHEFCVKKGMRGTILLSPEGINSTISGLPECMEELMEFMGGVHDDLKIIEYKDSWHSEKPFNRMLIKLKKEIVTFRESESNPLKQVGEYLDAEGWNALIQDPEVVLIDTRNDYEVEVGAFQNAINPKTETFTELKSFVELNRLDKEKTKVAMYCTGGIRCEKSTAYLLSLGFKNVYHLKGGILKYFEEVDPDESLFEGECFVFDKRVSVNHELEKGKYEICYACQKILTKEDMESSYYEEGKSCPYCVALNKG